ncbi:unnamed protein product (macronuclear) [Paramecium tetraurelia]|uniref:RING-type domain-containing protein n=1 Tax=Paramecium tetraurelia TaxID=5888 RepID=A0CTK6_PARTE|nr:uncharacterized protein GSPATT00010357001 [Paramecium tetraurelia]CAK74123.1 unnamed protein product [Paramecium tetraurelia]|eukprot:XP_001441520.1 hypothetical protein (macronuclear) [Paramecium tetraurelia strain d4-2]
MKIDEIIANPNLCPPKERKSTTPNSKEQINKLDQLLKGNLIENKVNAIESKKEISQYKQIDKKMPFKDNYSLLYNLSIGNKKIDQYTNQKQVQEIKEIPYVLENIGKQERQQFQIQSQFDQTEMLKAFEKKIHTLELFKEVKVSNKQEEFYEKNKGLLITSITCFENMVAFGTNRAVIYIQFNNQINQLEQNKKINHSPIICLRFLDKGTKLIGISEKQVLLYVKNEFVKAFQLKIESIPISMTVCQKSKNFKIQLLMADSLGNVYGIRIKQTLLKYGMQMKLELKENILCHQIESINFQDQEYILLTFKDQIQLVNLKPEYQLLMKLNYKVQENRIIQVKWQIEKKTLLIAVGNDNTLEVLSIQFEKQNDRLKSNLNLLCQYSFNNQYIQYFTWLSNDIIFVKHERKLYSLIGISEILKQKVDIIQKSLSQDIMSQKIGELLVFENSICNFQNQLFFISNEEKIYKSRIVQYKLNTWEDQMQQFQLNNELKEQFGMGLYLYSGKLIKLGNLPRIGRQEYLKPHLHTLVSRFVESSVKSQSFNSIYIAMDFLIMIESYEFLFNQIYLIYKSNRYERQFYESLESFINKGVIKQIPIDTSLKDILDYFSKGDKLKLLKFLIFNLDKSFINYSLIKEFCIQSNLQSILIYIPPKDIEDYKTPILTIFEIYQSCLNNNSQVLQHYFKSTKLDITSLSQKQIDEQIQCLGYKCIWFMSLIFKGESLSQEKIPEKYWPQIVIEILQWLLESEVLERFLQIDAGIFLNELLLILKDNKTYNKLQGFKDALDKQQGELSEIIIRNIYTKIKKLNIVSQFNCFILEIMKLGYQISYEDFLQVMIYNLRCPYENLKVFVDKSNFKFQKMEYKLQEDMTDQDKIKRDNLLIQYITFFTTQLLGDDQQLQSILSEASCSILSCSRIQSEIYCLKGDWIKCIGTMLASSSLIDKEYIFNYIDRILNSNQFYNQKEEIIKFCVTIVQQLADVSVEKLKILLQYFPNYLYKQAIVKLDNHPNFKLYLLNQIIQDSRNKNEIIDKQIMISYIRLLCKHHPQDVYDELQFGDFPQEDCMIICKEYKIMKGVAFLKERSGCLQEALDIYFDVIRTDFIALESGHSQLELQQQLLILILPCLKICRENCSNEDDNFQYWLTCVNRMLILRLEFRLQTNKFNSINKLFQEILMEMFESVHPKLIISNLSQLLKPFTHIEELRRTTVTLQKLCFFQLITHEQFIGNQTYQNFKRLEILYGQEQKGTLLMDRCLVCSQENEKYMYAFMSCCHIFHKQCLRLIKNVKVCKICLDKGIHSDQLNVQLEILVDNDYVQPGDQLIKQPTIEEQLQLSKQEQRQLRINKLKMLDMENEIKEILY